MPEEMKCGNCQEEIKKNWKVCPNCHADLTQGKYSATDDPVEILNAEVKKIKKYLEDKENDQPAATKRKKLFD